MVHPSLNSSGPAVLHLTSLRQPDATCLQLSGELDSATAAHLVSTCQQLTPPTGGLLRLDLTDLHFLDAAGLRALLHIAQLMTDRGHRLQIHRPRPLARRILTLTGLDTVLDIRDAPDVFDVQRAALDDILEHHPATG